MNKAAPMQDTIMEDLPEASGEGLEEEKAAREKEKGGTAKGGPPVWLQVTNMMATLFLALTTALLALITYLQVQESRNSILLQTEDLNKQTATIQQQTKALQKFDAALQDFKTALDIARANQASFDKIARATKDEASSSRAALGSEPVLVGAGGSCSPNRAGSPDQFTLSNPTSCDYIEVTLHNPGKIPIKAHATIDLGNGLAPCASKSLSIPADSLRPFSVHVDKCLAERAPGVEVPNPLTFHISANLDT